MLPGSYKLGHLGDDKKETPEEKVAREQVETIATEIAKLSRQVSALLSGRLNRKAVVILLVASCGLNQSQINMVLDAIIGLEDKYLNY